MRRLRCNGARSGWEDWGKINQKSSDGENIIGIPDETYPHPAGVLPLRIRTKPVSRRQSIRARRVDGPRGFFKSGIRSIAQTPGGYLWLGTEFGLLRLHRPDVTLMDLQMPALNGIEAIIGIRSGFPNARIIILTTYVGDVQVLRALKSGCARLHIEGARTQRAPGHHSRCTCRPKANPPGSRR